MFSRQIFLLSIIKTKHGQGRQENKKRQNIQGIIWQEPAGETQKKTSSEKRVRELEKITVQVAR
jgi:hypothetical protein